MQENICRIPVTATFSIINGKAVMTAAEYADIPAADIAWYLVERCGIDAICGEARD